MGELNTLFDRMVDTRAQPDLGVRSMLISMLFAFFLGQLIAWAYQWTHSGLSYSRSFTQSLVLLTMVVSLVMYVIGDSLLTAFGLIGALAIIRFRNVLKDTRDTVFVFFCLILGMATGSQRFGAALVGTLMLLGAVGYLYMISFGTKGHFDGHLTYRIAHELVDDVASELKRVTWRFCRSLKEVTVHDSGGQVEYVCEVRLRDRKRGRDMVQELRQLSGVADVALVLRDQHAEM